jgi:hypothetical protein
VDSLGHRLPYDSVSPSLASPSASDDEDADPTYRRSSSEPNPRRIISKLVHDLIEIVSKPG